MRNKKTLFGLLLPLTIIALTSCSSSSSEANSSSFYPVYTGTEELLTYSLDSSSFKSEYASGDAIDVKGITVSFKGVALNEGTYFFTDNKDNPSQSVIDLTNYYLQTSSQSAPYSFYVAYNDSQSQTLYVSKAIDVTIKNKSAVNPYLLYGGGAVIIIALGIWSYIRYKAKKEGR